MKSVAVTVGFTPNEKRANLECSPLILQALIAGAKKLEQSEVVCSQEEWKIVLDDLAKANKALKVL